MRLRRRSLKTLINLHSLLVISGELPTFTVNNENLKIPIAVYYHLTDPNFKAPRLIDEFLGTELYCQLFIG